MAAAECVLVCNTRVASSRRPDQALCSPGNQPLVFVYAKVYTRLGGISMAALKVGVREFRERIASFLEADTPVAVTRHGETLGVYVPTRRRRRKAAEISELRAAADRLVEALAEVDEEELVAEFKEMRRHGKAAKR